jgi:glycosyltransferase involved in cell wall biosynthesis
LRAAAPGAANIQILDCDLATPAYHRLIDSADVLLSLHRAEGFGIPLAEAMLRGKPVVATGWSGNLEFMSEDSACLLPARLVPMADEEANAYQGLAGLWAEPDIAAAAAWLRRLRDPVLRQRIGHAARSHAAARLSPATFGAAARPGVEGQPGAGWPGVTPQQAFRRM